MKSLFTHRRRLGADRVRRWWSYFGSVVLLALVGIALAVVSRTTTSFAVGVLLYAFVRGIAYAAFSAIVLFAIGRGAASTTYAGSYPRLATSR